MTYRSDDINKMFQEKPINNIIHVLKSYMYLEATILLTYKSDITNKIFQKKPIVTICCIEKLNL